MWSIMGLRTICSPNSESVFSPNLPLNIKLSFGHPDTENMVLLHFQLESAELTLTIGASIALKKKTPQKDILKAENSQTQTMENARPTVIHLPSFEPSPDILQSLGATEYFLCSKGKFTHCHRERK